METDYYNSLVTKYKSYKPDDSEGVALIQKAYEFAEVVYYNEKRLSGVPFLVHCLQTALLCAEYQLDAQTLAAAILHDSFTYGAKPNEISEEVSSEVAEMLVNLEKIKTIRNRYANINISEKSLYNDYLRRMILVFAKDIRVVLLRLLEKYDSLKDCESLPLEKKEIVIRNMLDIYVPLAEVLGLFDLKSNMENLAFEKQDFETFLKYRKILKHQKVSNEKKFEEFERKLKKLLATNGLNYINVSGRVKSEYSFYCKVKKYTHKYKMNEFAAIDRVHDKTAFRVILNTEEDCYNAYSLLKSEFNLIDTETEDYIKFPKVNGYRSIHTIIDLGKRNFIEVQIRTKIMHDYNEVGGASHTFYKLYGVSKVSEDKINYLKNLINWKLDLSAGKKEFSQLENSVLAITPKGDVIELPLGATVLDFAYHIHSGIGEKAVKSKVNGKLAKLNTVINTGDTVEIIIDKSVKSPKHEHLTFVTTKEAKILIKKRLKGKCSN